MPTALEILNEPVTESFIVSTNTINSLFKDKNEAGTKPHSQTKEGLEFEFFLKFQSFTLRKIKLQLYAAYIFLNLPPSKLNPFLFLL